MTSDLSLETKTCKRCGLRGYYLDGNGLCIECGKIWKEEREKRGRPRRRRAGRAARKEVMVVKIKVRRSDMRALGRLRRVALRRHRAMKKLSKASRGRKNGGARK